MNKTLPLKIIAELNTAELQKEIWNWHFPWAEEKQAHQKQLTGLKLADVTKIEYFLPSFLFQPSRYQWGKEGVEELEIKHQADILENEGEVSNFLVFKGLVPGEELHQLCEVAEQLWSFAHCQRRQRMAPQKVLIFWTDKCFRDKLVQLVFPLLTAKTDIGKYLSEVRNVFVFLQHGNELWADLVFLPGQ